MLELCGMSSTTSLPLLQGPLLSKVVALDRVLSMDQIELKSRYYVHFRTYTLGKGMNPIILPAMG